MLHEMGYETGIDLARLVGVRARGPAGAGPPAREPRADRRARGLARRGAEARRRRGRSPAIERGLGRAGRAALGRVGRPGGCASRAPRTCGSSRSATSRPSPTRRALHFAAGALAARARDGALAAAALASFELDFSGRSQWLRTAAAGGRGGERVGRLPGARRAHPDGGARGPPRRGAHRADVGSAPDRPGDSAAAKNRQAGVTRAAARAGVGRRRDRRAPDRRRRPRVLGAGACALWPTRRAAPWCPAPTTTPAAWPACWSWSGRLARASGPTGLEVIACSAGCEESGMGGMAAWIDWPGRGARPGRTLVVGLDTVGSGEPVVLEAEGGLWPVRYREEDVAWRSARRPRPGCRCGAGASVRGPTPCWPGWRGLPALSPAAVRDGGFPNYHLPARHAGERGLGPAVQRLRPPPPPRSPFRIASPGPGRDPRERGGESGDRHEQRRPRSRA